MKKFAFLIFLFLIFSMDDARASNYVDIFSVGAAYMINLGLHEIGHATAASEVGASDNKIDFFVNKNGSFYFGLSTAENLPVESKLPYHFGGFWMENNTFEYALQSYRKEPSVFNKSLMLFSGVNIFAYTISSYYVNPTNKSHDPNSIREDLGCSRGEWLSFSLLMTALNMYRIYDRDTAFVPIIMLTRDSVVFALRFDGLF